MLASALLITQGEGAEDVAQFQELLQGLHEDLQPVGTVEEMLVEKIAICWWRQRRALRCEAGLVRRVFVHQEEPLDREFGVLPNFELESIKEHLSLPLGADLDRILRYETTIQHQLAYAMNQLDRLQRVRKGEQVQAPLSVQVSGGE